MVACLINETQKKRIRRTGKKREGKGTRTSERDWIGEIKIIRVRNRKEKTFSSIRKIKINDSLRVINQNKDGSRYFDSL